MSDLFDVLDRPTAQAEGGYVNNPHDPGGETNFGVTVAVARAEGYTGAMRDMTADQAKAIRRSRYYVKPRLDQVAAIAPENIVSELYDTGINMGPKVAAIFLQRALNVLNRQGRDYPDVDPDGDLGAETLAALRGFLAARGAAAGPVLLKALNCLQGARYIELAERLATNEDFEFGWLAQRVGLGD